MSIKTFFKTNFSLGFISIIFLLVTDFVWIYSPSCRWNLYAHIIPTELAIVFTIVYHVWVVITNYKWILELETAYREQCLKENRSIPKNPKLELWSWAVFGFCYPYILIALYTYVVCYQHGAFG